VPASPLDPLPPDERARLVARPRPRRDLPLTTAAPVTAPARRLPLLDAVRPLDRVGPIYAVWEVTLACDLACRHGGSIVLEPAG
jgi:hypothetical protein